MNRNRQLADQVSTTIASFEHLVATETPADAEVLSKARVVLVQCVNAYIAHLGMTVAALGTESKFDRWRQAHAGVVSLRTKYSEHIGRYTAANIKADWKGYRTGCQGLVVAMRRHLDEVTAWSPID